MLAAAERSDIFFVFIQKYLVLGLKTTQRDYSNLFFFIWAITSSTWNHKIPVNLPAITS